jgi:ankyrin repeat protein
VTDANLQDRFGLTALHYAAGGGHLEIVESLVEAKANLDSCDKDGDTPLHNAVKVGSE